MASRRAATSGVGRREPFLIMFTWAWEMRASWASSASVFPVPFKKSLMFLGEDTKGYRGYLRGKAGDGEDPTKGSCKSARMQPGNGIPYPKWLPYFEREVDRGFM